MNSARVPRRDHATQFVPRSFPPGRVALSSSPWPESNFLSVKIHYRYPLELKIRRSDKTVPDGLRQLTRYLDTLGEPEAVVPPYSRLTWQSWGARNQ